MFNVLEVEPMRNRTLKTNDTNWRKLKNGEIKAEQIEINALQIQFNLGGTSYGREQVKKC